MSHLPDVAASLEPEEAARLAAMMSRRAGTGSAAYARLMAHPALTRRLSDLGAFLRYEGVLPGDLRELVILAVAARRRCAYEWVMHAPLALGEGVPPDAVEALRRGGRPSGLGPAAAAALRMVAAVQAHEAIPQEAHDAMAEVLGVEAVIETAYLAAFYDMFAAGLLGFEVPLPDGAEDPFGDA